LLVGPGGGWIEVVKVMPVGFWDVIVGGLGVVQVDVDSVFRG
jgi:hypothetical protein